MIEINNQELKNYGKPFIVAEAGINHNGELTKAIQMIEVAKRSGADAVKFQTFRAEEFYGDKNQMFTYQSQGQKITESMFEMLVNNGNINTKKQNILEGKQYFSMHHRLREIVENKLNII